MGGCHTGYCINSYIEFHFDSSGMENRFQINQHGSSGQTLRYYASSEVHSSIEKGIKNSRYWRINLVKIEVDKQGAIRPDKLREAILDDIKNGFTPTAIIAALGTTGTTAIDPLPDIIDKKRI